MNKDEGFFKSRTLFKFVENSENKGRYQTLFRGNLKSLNFENILSASYFSLKKTPTAKI